jgi:hypothetical protein
MRAVAHINVEGGSQGRLPPSTAGFGYLFNLVKIKSASLRKGAQIQIELSAALLSTTGGAGVSICAVSVARHAFFNGLGQATRIAF